MIAMAMVKRLLSSNKDVLHGKDNSGQSCQIADELSDATNN